LSHFRNDLDCWNFLYLNPPWIWSQRFQCRNAVIRNAAPSKMLIIPPVIDAPPSCSFATIRPKD
jgi:hypothetical protein